MVSSSKRGGLCAVGVPLPKGRANHHTFTLPPERGPKFAVFSAPSLRPAGCSSVRTSSEIRGPVEGGNAPCTAIHKNKIPNIHTLQPHHNTLGTHNMHKHNLSPINKLLEMRTTHNTHRTNSIHTPHKYHQPIPNYAFPNNYFTHRLHSRHSAKGASYQSTYVRLPPNNITNQLTRYQSTHTQQPPNCTSRQQPMHPHPLRPKLPPQPMHQHLAHPK